MTVGGRVTGIIIMLAGVGLIGVLASLLSSLLLGSPAAVEEEAAEVPSVEALLGSEIHEKLAAIEGDTTDLKNEMAELRQLLEKISAKVVDQ